MASGKPGAVHIRPETQPCAYALLDHYRGYEVAEDMAIMGETISLAMAAEDICHLQIGTH
jgi:hypothetical protein